MKPRVFIPAILLCVFALAARLQDEPTTKPIAAATRKSSGPFVGPPAPTTKPAIAPATTQPAVASTRPSRAPGAATTKAVSRVPRPTGAIPKKGCVTHECHVAVRQYKVLHGPVNVNECDVCHLLTDAKKHTFKQKRGKTAMCTFCHKTMKTLSAAVVHKPVKNGECLPCHDPHGGTNKSFLRGRSMKEMCATCHKNIPGKKRMVHGPVAAGACGACHKGHSSKLPKLLVAQGRALCLGCHAEMEKQLANAKVRHKAVDKDCMACHSAHASDYAKQTRFPPKTLCTNSCHKEIKKITTAAKYKHSIVVEGQACLACHTAHGGDLAKLMKSKPIDACMKCHSKKIVVDKDRTIAAVAEVLDPKMNRHGPIREGNCGGCHVAHGGDVPSLLAKAHPATFYQPFQIDEYALCFRCHNKQAVLMKETTKVTGFRNGKVNLHYLHVNKSKKGRTCRACHSTHASTNPMHVRESVPYGNWKLPVKFEQSKTGGKCAAGCHKALAYDRDNPVAMKILPKKPAGAGSSGAKE